MSGFEMKCAQATNKTVVRACSLCSVLKILSLTLLIAHGECCFSLRVVTFGFFAFHRKQLDV